MEQLYSAHRLWSHKHGSKGSTSCKPAVDRGDAFVSENHRLCAPKGVAANNMLHSAKIKTMPQSNYFF